MRGLALIVLLLLTACHPDKPDDCEMLTSTPPPYDEPDLTQVERTSLEISGERAASASQTICGFGEGVNSSNVMVDMQ